jgi:Large eukaryotic DNA virus major capsid protein/Major capsid protein N-terminus
MNQSFEYIFPKTVTFGTDTLTPIPQDGDYIESLLIHALMPFPTSTPFLDFIERFELIIDGNVIERHYGETIKIMNELYVPTGKQPGLKRLVGGAPDPQIEFFINVPLSFRVPLLTAPSLRMVLKPNQSDVKLKFVVDFSYFDKLPTEPLTFLAQTFQRLEFETESKQVTLNTLFQNNVKELFWTTSQQDSLIDNIESIELNLSGTILLDKYISTGQFLKTVQPLVHHTRVPTVPIYMYSFAIDPERPQPTGEIQMTPITVQKHLVTFKESLQLTLRAYALSTTRFTVFPDGSSILEAPTQEQGFINIVTI